MGRVETALAGTGFPWAHHGWSHAPEGDYGVWGEERGADLLADGVHVERGTVYYASLFTRDDSSAPRDAVEAALNGLSACGWTLNSVQYEHNTGYINYEWLIGLRGQP